MKLLLHGGAGNDVPEDIAAVKQAAVDEAFAQITNQNLSALDAVEEAVVLMELAPVLNAGYGCVLQIDGQARLDAAICASDGRYGGVVQIRDTKTPVRVARKLLDYDYHGIVSGQGACDFARECGFEAESPISPDRQARYEAKQGELEGTPYESLVARKEELNKRKLSTVGAVALDDQGNLAAACSTGGTYYCYPGRVGDTAIMGGGLYCSEHVAVACTGEGDKMLRRLTAKRVEDIYLAGGDLKTAAQAAVDDVGGGAGIVAISKDGDTASVYNTDFMSHAGTAE